MPDPRQPQPQPLERKEYRNCPIVENPDGGYIVPQILGVRGRDFKIDWPQSGVDVGRRHRIHVIDTRTVPPLIIIADFREDVADYQRVVEIRKTPRQFQDGDVVEHVGFKALDDQGDKRLIYRNTQLAQGEPRNFEVSAHYGWPLQMVPPIEVTGMHEEQEIERYQGMLVWEKQLTEAYHKLRHQFRPLAEIIDDLSPKVDEKDNPLRTELFGKKPKKA